MASASISGMCKGVAGIVKGFHEASQLFLKWRQRGVAKKAAGQEEFASSLVEGERTVEEKYNMLYYKYQHRFDIGDRTSLSAIINIEKNFSKSILDVLLSSMDGRDTAVDPVKLKLISDATRRTTIQTLDDLARRLEIRAANPRQAAATASTSTIDLGDLLPPAPLPTRKITPNSSQVSLTPEPQKRPSANANQTSPAASSASLPIPGKNNQLMPVARLGQPTFDDEDESGSSAMIRKMPSASAISRMFKAKPYKLPPHIPSAPVVPTFTYADDKATSDLLKEGRDSVAKLWAAVESSRPSLQVEPVQQYSSSAPPTQAPWHLRQEVPRSSTPSRNTKEVSPVSPIHENESNHPKIPVPIIVRPPYQEKKMHSEPNFVFSSPTPRFRRNVSGPPGAY